MTVTPTRVSPQWLALRESADAAARSPALLRALREHLPRHGTTVVHDLGCGTGAMARWLAPQLPGPQHWVMYDHDPDLLGQAALAGPASAADGSRVTVETRQLDVSRLGTSDLCGASLVTASALLDLMTKPELERLVATCVGAACPVLLTLSVVGHVRITPRDPLDAQVADAFNAHQRRTAEGRTLLGPDAVAVAAEAFARAGAQVRLEPSPWRLGVSDASLIARWFAGWVGAASEERPQLALAAASYARRRLAAGDARMLGVTVQHRDLLVVTR